MSIDITDLVDQACRRADISLDMLTDDKIDALPSAVIARPYDQSVTLSADRYITLTTGVALLFNLEEPPHVHLFGDLLEDCQDYWPLASFMRAVVAILRETPDILPGVAVDESALYHVEAAIGD